MSTSPLGRPERPLHHRPRAVALVAVGGALGTAARAGVGEALHLTGGDAAGWPWGTWAVNLSGAFLLGLLLERLARSGPDDGRRRDVRLLAGTGFLGGYTTYSALALDTVTLAGAGDVAAALAYAGSTLALGVAAAGAGIALGHRPRDRAASGPAREGA